MFAKKVLMSLIFFAGFHVRSTAWSASSNKNGGESCRVMLKGIETSKKASASLLVVSTSEHQYREIVEIRDGEKQFPQTTRFNSEYVEKYHYYQDVSGDRISVHIYPQASPYSAANPWNAQNRQQQVEGRSGVGVSYQVRGSVVTRPPQQVSQLNSPVSDYEMAKAYALKQFAQTPDPTSLDYVVKTILDSKELLAEAKRFNVAIRNTPSIELTNYGINRYFWFKPEGASEYVAGRVLDIHRQKNPEAFVFLVEYMSEVNSVTGVRNRKVVQLRESEFQSIVARVDGLLADRTTAMERFFDSLTPDEIETLKLANSMQLKLFGYFDIRRGPGIEASTSPTPLETMNNISHLAIQHYILKTFGSVEDLMTPFEKQLPYANFMDIFSRLDPRYVMTRFGDSRARDTEFYWIITEDGQLKIMPAMQKGNNLKPQILRFAAGRKIFAGGTFFLGENGALNIRLEANGFQQNDMSWGSHQAYQSQNGNINAFVKIVFGIQLGRRVSGLQAENVENWYRKNPDQANQDDSANRYHPGYDGSSANTNYDFKSKMSAKAQAATSSDQKVVTWDLEKGKPLDLSAFAKARNASDRDPLTQEEWAHYILQTHSRMTYENIKKQYRRLAMKFHPDKNSKAYANEIMQYLSYANQILEAQLKK